MRLVYLILLVITITGCHIPVVGNSPEEIKYRKHMNDNKE